ncbi:UPF0280 family protein [Methylobrevis albus]|uniref:UPF0280 family protein n=1 Tax=Methylobrevis albus TaxID=2793297 RepID=A0A931HY39_9HYPH|nr:UPF0280 family protein [Methylobrevis albus]MBH0236537.1 UPF0280 family protein [Methylobrevis albus]
MFDPPIARLLPDGRRLHLGEGPIDLVIRADGAPEAVAAAYRAAAQRFEGLLAELCDELPLLRSPVLAGTPVPEGPVARRMHRAVAPFAERMFITPMAAVAGAVADEILAAIVAAGPLERAFVNNGGDIALHLAPGASLSAGLVDRPDRAQLFGRTEIAHADPVRGIATSGRHGRSFSLGIADAVTVLAGTAAAADAAATMIANAVDLPGHPAVTRVPANELQPDSDLGSLRVTRAVGPLGAAEIDAALARGLAAALQFRTDGLIAEAALHLAGTTRTTGPALPAGTDRRTLIHA